MGVVNSRVKAGSSLVAPQGISSVGYNVRECTVEELKQFIPLRGVVESCLVTAETNGIMDYVLIERERGRGRERERERERERGIWNHYICNTYTYTACIARRQALTNSPRRSPTLNSQTGAFRMNMSSVSLSAIGGK